jgi:DNA polymerase-3 subunit alpha
MGIEVLPPDVNESFVEFAVVPVKKPKIRFGMAAIKNVCTGAVEEILRAREERNFKSLEDFLSRVEVRIVNRKALESLIKAGAFDRFNDRSTLLANLDTMLSFASRLQKQHSSGQTDLFGAQDDKTLVKAELQLANAGTVYTTREQLLWERELLGLFLSQNPLELYANFLSEQTIPLASLSADNEGRNVTVGGAVSDVRAITTKNGQKMAFAKIEDQSGEIELILFPSSFQQTTGLWDRDRVVLVRGKVSTRDRDGATGGEVKIIVDDAREITHEQATNYQLTGKKMKIPASRRSSAASKAASIKPLVSRPTPERIYIRLADGRDETLLVTLKSLIDRYDGKTEVVLVLGENDSKQAIKLPSKIDKTDFVLAELSAMVGQENVVVR